MNFLVIFTLLTIVNVIASTIKTIVTVNGGKFAASLSSALYYGYYNIVIIYTVADFPLWQKVVITTVCNLIGVYLVKWMEEHSRKEKLWLVKITIKPEWFAIVTEALKQAEIPFSYYNLEKYYVIDCYCQTCKQTDTARETAKMAGGKLFATESSI